MEEKKGELFELEHRLLCRKKLNIAFPYFLIYKSKIKIPLISLSIVLHVNLNYAMDFWSITQAKIAFFSVYLVKLHSQLRLVGVRSGVGHAEDAPALVAEELLELVLERLPPEGLPARARALGVAALDLHIFTYLMEP